MKHTDTTDNFDTVIDFLGNSLPNYAGASKISIVFTYH